MELFAKKKSAEKENLIRVIAQTNKKIEYLKEFRVFIWLFRPEKPTIYQFCSASRKERTPTRPTSSKTSKKSSTSTKQSDATSETTSAKKSTTSKNYKSIN